MTAKASLHSSNHAASYYAASANRETAYPQLEGSQTADVCIVGGGFTGVSTALELSAKGFSVIVLEARKLGWGASGRNGGQLIRGIGEDPEQFHNQIGTDGVRAIQHMGFESVQLVRDRIARHDIQCDLKMGYMDVALNRKHYRDFEEDYEQLKALQYPHEIEMVSAESIQNYVGTERYVGGLYDAGSGHLHPLNLLLGEAEVAEQQGTRFFEYSVVTEIQKTSRPVVKTDHGSVTCDFLVLAGNAYLGDLEPEISAKVLPAGSYIIATEPLSEEVCQQIIPEDMAICDAAVALDYYRLSADRRLLFGGRCNYSGRDPQDITAAMRPKMLDVFPQLNEVAIDFEWGGHLGIGANRMPQIGRLNSSVYYAQAYAGHGVNATHMAGHVLAEVISGQAERFDVFAGIHHRRFPEGKYFRSELLALGMLWYRLKELL
ncbi:FAD-dependent oxidoreductase [Endozoicomonas montiporae]|uniref:FAD-dependent oxidoreductase n=2 Tax=Endozoicomonas montiporae TaxID=1027273 RepID=A0A081N5B0_9GAMM|nr:FAD-binding oxidoreductase [Endozoicomonas montiporae]AMO57484.1 gamma-glutamylputrescine oxidase [Endozoicomonas montiporae CL-33]KEQ13633.1 FAD-dependent oxidoreductase [Endozoicomonas montiporae]